MRLKLIDFCVQDDGAVTVDWVVLTAAIVGLGLAVVSPIATGTTSMSTTLTNYVATVQVGGGSP